MFPTIYMHQFVWVSERGGNFLNLLQKEGVARKEGGGVPQKRGGSNPGGNYDLVDFNWNYLNKLLENISKEQKSIFLLGDFNVNLLNEHNEANQFLVSLASNSFIPLVLQPTRITSHSNTLIDNIFSNVIDPDIISGNLTATISDHLLQFAIFSYTFGNIPGNKSNIYEGDWTKFDQENFILDYFSVDREALLKIDELNADNWTKTYLDKINIFLDTHAPLKKLINTNYYLSLSLG